MWNQVMGLLEQVKGSAQDTLAPPSVALASTPA
jgi:hypothetical protein